MDMLDMLIFSMPKLSCAFVPQITVGRGQGHKRTGTISEYDGNRPKYRWRLTFDVPGEMAHGGGAEWGMLSEDQSLWLAHGYKRNISALAGVPDKAALAAAKKEKEDKEKEEQQQQQAGELEKARDAMEVDGAVKTEPGAGDGATGAQDGAELKAAGGEGAAGEGPGALSRQQSTAEGLDGAADCEEGKGGAEDAAAADAAAEAEVEAQEEEEEYEELGGNLVGAKLQVRVASTRRYRFAHTGNNGSDALLALSNACCEDRQDLLCAMLVAVHRRPYPYSSHKLTHACLFAGDRGPRRPAP